MKPRDHDYAAPSADAMLAAQDSLPALRLQIAQRALYAKAKRWSYLRWIGFSVIAIVAPVIAVVFPKAAAIVGAVSGVWIFLARTIFKASESNFAAQGAAVQEDFDRLVFAMPPLATREPRPTPEDISRLAGPEAQIPQRAERNDLDRWYPIDRSVAGAVCVAIGQRANAAYSERLQRINAWVWLTVLIVWAIVIIAISIATRMTLTTFLLGVGAPLLPAYLDVGEQWRASTQACTDRRSMADDIEAAVRGTGSNVLTDDDLLVWQERLYGLRRSAPLVPEVLYKRMRDRNEQAMNDAAAQLWAAAKHESTLN